MSYKDCEVIYDLSRKEDPLISNVPTDEFTKVVQNNFDYEFDGESKFYPYKIPKGLKDLDFDIMVIVGASGGGKSTFLKEFDFHDKEMKEYDSSKAIVSNFETPTIATEQLSAVGLNTMPVWCRPRKVLSVGEGFRADLALNLESNRVYDEFTSTIDRNVAKSTSNSVQKYIRNNGLKNMIFCSCHGDYIPYMNPDIVVDLDEEKVYDCREQDLGKQLNYKSTNQQISSRGKYLKTITI